MRPDCSKCKTYHTCTKLCSAAEAYANQDKVRQKEKTVGVLPESSDPVWSENNASWINTLSTKEMMICALIQCGYSHSQIRKVLKIRYGTYFNILHNIRKKMKK